MISKDQSIVTQVAAKIAADMAVAAGGVDILAYVANWAIAFEAVSSELNTVHGFGSGAPDVTAQVQRAFPNTVEYRSEPQDQYSQPFGQADQNTVSYGTVRIKGEQHGPLPEWLAKATAKAGVTEVYDNRPGLAENNKRPWFKATSGGKDAIGFWPPK